MLGLQACTTMLGTEPKVLFKDGEILPTLVVRVQHQEMLSGEQRIHFDLLLDHLRDRWR